MREEVPQIAEHAFGYGVKAQVTVENPQYAILLGLRSLGWMTYEQCCIRVFSWSNDQLSIASDANKRLVWETLLEMEEVGLVNLKKHGTWHFPDGHEEPWISEIHAAIPRFTRRYHQRINEGNNDSNC